MAYLSTSRKAGDSDEMDAATVARLIRRPDEILRRFRGSRGEGDALEPSSRFGVGFWQGKAAQGAGLR
jgi:hypothetical protein